MIRDQDLKPVKYKDTNGENTREVYYRIALIHGLMLDKVSV